MTASGLPTIFTQTGGMCAALEVQLETGYTLLITDFEEPLPWDRDDQVGWRVGMYASHVAYDQELVRDAGVKDTSTVALLAVVREVLPPPVTTWR